MERDNLIQIVTLIIAIVALILALFAVAVPGDKENKEDEPENEAPTASISVASTSVLEMENVLFDASGSTDSDGTIVECTWDFGDGAKDSGMYSNHAFSTANTYTVTLTVIDNDGATDVNTTIITVTEKVIPANIPPVASLLLSASSTDMYEHINCDGSSSTDSDGAIVMYLWDFGDGTNSTGIYTNHYYTTPGTYSIMLTVTDNGGAKNSSSGNIIINTQTGPPMNNRPVAVIDAGETTVEENDIIYFNSLDSTDIDGDIIAFIWDFGDGNITYGISIYHSYETEGIYNVTLKVYDNNGASDTDFVIITVNAPPATPTGALSFTENTVGNYTGGIITLSQEVLISDVSITIIDNPNSTGTSLDPVQSGVSVQDGLGMNLTYYDSNSNGKIDPGDVWVIKNGSSGDVIKLIFKPTGNSIAEYTLQ